MADASAILGAIRRPNSYRWLSGETRRAISRGPLVCNHAAADSAFRGTPIQTAVRKDGKFDAACNLDRKANAGNLSAGTFRSSMKKIPTTDREEMAECLVRDEKRIQRMKPSAKRDAAKAEFERLSARFLEVYSRTHRDVFDHIQTGAE